MGNGDMFDGIDDEEFEIEKTCLKEGGAGDMIRGYQLDLRGLPDDKPDGVYSGIVPCDFEDCRAVLEIFYRVDGGKKGEVTRVDEIDLNKCWKERR